MYMLIKIFFGTIIAFFLTGKGSLQQLTINTLTERIKKLTPFCSLKLTQASFSQERDSYDLSGIGFLGEAYDDADAPPSLFQRKNHRDPDETWVNEDPYRNVDRTPNENPTIEKVVDKQRHLEEVKPSISNRVDSADLSGIGFLGEAYNDADAPPSLFQRKNHRDPDETWVNEDPYRNVDRAPNENPTIDKVVDKQHYLEEVKPSISNGVDSSKVSDQKADLPEKNIEDTSASLVHPILHTDEKVKKKVNIDEKDHALLPLEKEEEIQVLLTSCSSLQAESTQEIVCKDYTREVILPHTHQLSGVLLLHSQTMVQMNQVMTRTSQDTCGDKKLKNSLSIQGIGSYYDQGKRQNLLDFTSQIYGVGLGYAYSFVNNWNAKAFTGYSYSNLHWGQSRGKAFLHSIYLGASADYVAKQWYAQGFLIGARTLYKIKRNIDCLGLIGSSDHKGWDLSIGAKGGIPIKLRYCLLIPEAEFIYLNFFEDGYREHQSQNKNLEIHRKHSSILHEEISIRIAKKLLMRNFCLFPSIRVGYAREDILSNNQYRVEFYRSQSCKKATLKGFHGPVNLFLLQAMATFYYRSLFVLNMGYQLKLGSHTQIHEGKIDLNWNF